MFWKSGTSAPLKTTGETVILPTLWFSGPPQLVLVSTWTWVFVLLDPGSSVSKSKTLRVVGSKETGTICSEVSADPTVVVKLEPIPWIAKPEGIT